MFNTGCYIDFLPHVTEDLEGVLPSFLTWSQVGLMIALTLGFSIGCALSERYGNYRVFATAFIVYAAASYLCFIRQSFLLFLSGRILLGFAGGLKVLVGQIMLLNEYPDRLKPLGGIDMGVVSHYAIYHCSSDRWM